MRVERSIDSQRDIAYILKELDTVDQICVKHGKNCYKCPLGKLGVFDSPTCDEISKVRSRLELAYKVVETI